MSPVPCSLPLWVAQGDILSIYFGQGSALVDTAAEANLRQRVSMWRRAMASGVIVSPSASPLIESSCSPEGPIALNDRLAWLRAQAVLRLVGGEEACVTARPQPDWTWLFRCLRTDHSLPARAATLQQVGEWAEVKVSTKAESVARLATLRRLGGGQVWQHIRQHHFASLRFSRVVLPGTYAPLSAIGLGMDSLSVGPAVLSQKGPVLASVWAGAPKKPFYMALKTNLLLDAVLLPNVGAELALGSRWSVVAGWAYNWLHTDARHFYWRIYGGDVEVRRWLGHRKGLKPLTGHHVGGYIGMLTYDIELGGRGYLGERWSIFGGVSYGYSLPIGRRLNLDYTVGLGYLGGTYKEYLPDEECYVWQSTKKRRYIGPTKLEISLVWLIGRGNCNARKGGRL